MFESDGKSAPDEGCRHGHQPIERNSVELSQLFRTVLFGLQVEDGDHWSRDT